MNKYLRMITTRKLLTALASMGISSIFMLWVLHRIDISKLLSLISQGNPCFLIASGGLAFLLPFSCTVRWIGILGLSTSSKISFFIALRAVMVSSALNAILPSKLGDVTKAVYLLRRTGISYGVGTVIVERMVDLLLLGFAGVMGSVLSKHYWGVVISSSIVTLVVAVAVASLLMPSFSFPAWVAA